MSGRTDERRRNVVLLTFDSVRADHCGFGGYDRDTTPTLDRLAADGTCYENAIAPASRTNPSMAGILTGEPLVVRERVSDPRHSRSHLRRHGTLAESFSERGYATAAFNPNAYASRYYGFDRGFDHYEDFLFTTGWYQRVFSNHLGSSSAFTALRNARNFVRRQEAFKTWDTYVDDIEDWVRSRPDDEPFFLWAFSLDTHFPYITPRGHRRWSNALDQYRYNWLCNRIMDETGLDLSEKQVRKIVDLYDDALRYGDRFVAELRERLDEFDPVFVVHADHGEAFCERGVYGHLFADLYEENVHVPMVVGGPGIESRTVERPLSLARIPEIVDAASRGAELPDGDDWAVATEYDGRLGRNLTAVRARDRKFLQVDADDGSRRECYDLASDPGERTNLYGEDEPVDELLATLASRRLAHEREQLAIRDAAAELDDTGPRRAVAPRGGP
ncbi:sulfatase [Haloarchaeobius litoreus]|uniref:Sulfatase n=1 Tax=Haloarchaeobius litoreus TaxID=755306 RepID=A0ABD6DQQ4_9EURY